jgi:hypothetical protein
VSLGGSAMALVRVLGRALCPPAAISRTARIATASVAESLLRLVRLQLASDIGRLKNSMLQRHEAETSVARADARRRAAEAVEAENRVTLARRDDWVAQAERRKTEADARKAEADALKAESEATIAQAVAVVAQAQANATLETVQRHDSLTEKEEALKAAVRRLNQKGGGLFVSEAAFHRLLRAPIELYDQSKADEEEGEP